jgi:hypothetical protein
MLITAICSDELNETLLKYINREDLPPVYLNEIAAVTNKDSY